MIKKSLKKGYVKKVEQDELKVVILGPVNKNTGLYLEKVVHLHCLEPARGQEKEFFEFIRSKIVGKEIEFNDYDLGDRVAADVYVGGVNVGYLLAREGLIRHFQAGQKTSVAYDDLVEGDKEAQKAKKGQFAELSDEEIKKKKRKQKRPDLEDILGKEVHGWIEELNFKLDFQFYVVEMDAIVTASFAGVILPVVNKEHVTHLRNFCAKHIFQRNRPVRFKQIQDQTTGETINAIVELNNSDEESLLRNLILGGYARLEKEASAKLELVELMALKSLQDQAINSGKGIWKDFKGKLPTQEKKGTENADLAKLLKLPDFEAKVLAVHSGDTLTIEVPGGQELRVNFTNLKARAIGNASKDEDPQPWAFEAKDYLRKKLIGKTVVVKIDNIRNVVTDDRTFDVINVTVTLDGKLVALEMVEKGLLAVVPPRMSDPSSAALVSYSEAAKKAESQKKGLHSDVQPVRRFWDLTKPDLRKKAKSEFALENYKDPNNGVVENVIAATRFKVRFDQENCYFILSLNSVRGVPNNVNNKTEEKWANEALAYSRSVAAQRDVKFEIEQVDKNGVAHGSLFIGKENLAVVLLKRGLAYVDKGFRHSKNINEYFDLQEAAKAAKKGIWGDVELNKAGFGGEGDGEVQGEVKKVVLSEYFGPDDFYLQEKGSENYLKVEKGLKKLGESAPYLKEPILAGTLAIAEFEGEFNRCKVVRKKKDNYAVEFIDYGNTADLSVNELRQCPNDLQKIPPLAINARLDFVRVPPFNSSYAKQTGKFFEKLGVNAKLKAKVTRKEQGSAYVVMWPASAADEDIKKSINYTLVKDGLAVLKGGLEGGLGDVWTAAESAGALKNPELISYMNNIDED